MSHGRDRDTAVERWLRRTSASEAPFSAAGPCPDAEEIAAWADGGMSAEATSNIERHLSACARCQAIAGTMARTESIAEWALPERRSPWRWLTWAIPLTGAATIAMLVLLDRQMLETRRGAAPPPVSTQSKADPPAGTRERAELNDQARADTPSDRGTAAAKVAEEKQRPGNFAKAENEQRSRDTRSPARPAAPPAPVAAPPPVAEPTAPRQPQQQVAEKSARAEELDRLAMSRLAAAPLEIRSADGTVRWRVTGTQVQRSVDAGSTWSPVDLGLPAVITAGAAPTSTTCWLVGRGGTVLLTTDGKTFTRVTSPDATDLSAVRATDARNATVTAADGREFATTDGGRTWVRRDLQENPAAPF